MTYRESNDHVTDDVAWSRKVKGMTPIRFEPNVSKIAGYAIFIMKSYSEGTGKNVKKSYGGQIWNYEIKNSTSCANRIVSNNRYLIDSLLWGSTVR